MSARAREVLAAAWHCWPAFLARYYLRQMWDDLPGPWPVKAALVVLCLACPGPAGRDRAHCAHAGLSPLAGPPGGRDEQTTPRIRAGLRFAGRGQPGALSPDCQMNKLEYIHSPKREDRAMARVITARRADTCRECSGAINAGERINYGGPGAITHEACRAIDAPRTSRGRRGGRYAYASSGARMTDRRGRCEDAPCCGCCD